MTVLLLWCFWEVSFIPGWTCLVFGFGLVFGLGCFFLVLFVCVRVVGLFYTVSFSPGCFYSRA